MISTNLRIIAIAGSYGTLTEMAYAFDLGKKVFGLKSWDLEKVGVPKSLYVPVKTPREAVDRAIEEARRNTP